ncbi:helix-turn-helix domain-containing protein [Roseospira goensis]|uniref:Transcriptional regulator with XRE-family HTH domain n=1 Tax=Roseospira goensis TaxID=391922 RepID=A0A7W6S1Y9_9PROT|nr:helix-turn-helix transcriptional regulator [Roseospira goensis]MBB4287408.1 transcriptional regulator with XRE-family HTH domain [Roseospira goensis]
MKPECDAGFHARLNLILADEKSSTAFARRAGLSQSGFRRIEKGGEPGLQSLLSIAQAAGVSIEWLATGEGPMRRDPAPAQGQAQERAQDQPRGQAATDAATAPPESRPAPPAPPALDGRLLGMCFEGIKRTYKEANARIDDRSAGIMAARLYEDVLAATADDPDPEPARRAALRMGLQHLRRDLQTPASPAASSKHSA